MENNLKNALIQMKDEDFRELELHVHMASKIRSLIKEFELDDDRIVELFKIKKIDIPDFINASYVYDLKTAAIVETVYIKLHSERAKKQIEKVAAETVLPIAK